MSKVILLFLLLCSFPTVQAAAPCSGKKSGISHCEGSQFVCNDGSYSRSTKDCAQYLQSKRSQAKPNSERVSATNKVLVLDTSTVPDALSASDPETSSQTLETSPFLQGKIERDKSTQILKLDYPGFTIWLDCAKRAAVKFQYIAQHDTGNMKRYDRFYLDPKVPTECQQTTAEAYGMKYDRGHQVPANHLDASVEMIKATNVMTNILPQAANMNRGAWMQTEEIIECYRDIDELLIVGGALWSDHSGDEFVRSHGVKTPDAFWKIVIRGTGQDERVIAWLIFLQRF